MRGSKAFLFAVLSLGAGVVLLGLGLGLAPATTEALPFAVGLLAVGTLVAVPSYRTLKAALAPDAAELPFRPRWADERLATAGRHRVSQLRRPGAAAACLAPSQHLRAL